uniref:Twinkle protein, mitochondrial n=1 Tax=Phallusia mammillata TaxID=59560 RepID=A0A6F9DW80_9ASCI|nr:twinkle protein, mitochondrial [Phallusia mammillata]
MLPLYMMTFNGAQDIAVVLETMYQATFANDIQHVIIDNLQFMLGNRSEQMDKFTYQDYVIGEFRKFATREKVHVTIVIHPRKEDSNLPLQISSIFGSAKATQEADNVLILQSTKSNSSHYYRKYLEICKNRFDGDVGNVALYFDRQTLCMSLPSVKNKSTETVHSSVKNDFVAQKKKYNVKGEFSTPSSWTEKWVSDTN